MKYYVYETTNNINGKIYVGITGRDLLAGNQYIGSGTLIRRAIKKYGKENFNRKILCIVGSRDFALELESKIVDCEFINRYDTYNIQIGGSSGPAFNGEENGMYGKTHSSETKQKMSEVKLGNNYGCGRRSNETRQKIINAHKDQRCGMYGKTHSTDTKEKIRKTRIGKHLSNETKLKLSKINSKSCIIQGLEFGSQNEASKYFGVGRSTISRWIKKESIK